MYQIPGQARRQHGRAVPQQDDMSQILAMYQMFSPEQQAREELIRAQAAQTQQETAFAQMTMDPRIEAMQRQAQHDQIIQQQLQMQMQQAQAMGPEQLRALQLQNDYLAQHGKGERDGVLQLQQAGQMADFAQRPQGQAYAMAQALTDPEQRKQIYAVNPTAQFTPSEYDAMMKQIGPFGPGKDTYKGTEPVPHPVEVGRHMTEYMQKYPGLDTLPWDEHQKQALEVYKSYMGMPSEWDTDPHWLQQAQAAKSVEDLQKLKAKWEHSVFSASQARGNPSAYIDSGFGGF